jgi:predicted ATP-grasp superfamily ATP-dependent carboligase
VGLAVPRTLLCDEPARLTALPEPFRYPVVLKARRSRFLRDGRWVSGSAHVVRDAAELAQVRMSAGLADGALLQEFVPGSGEGVFLLCARGRPLARFAQPEAAREAARRRVSVLSEAIAPDPELLRGSERLLADLGFTGVAMVEFSVGRPDGPRLCLLEVNPRLWGSLQPRRSDAGGRSYFPRRSCSRSPTPRGEPSPARADGSRLGTRHALACSATSTTS